MLRVYSILQLEPLWLKPKPQCELIVQEEEAVAPIQVIQETEVLVEEPTSYQQEVVEPEYQVVEQEVVHVVHRTNTSTEESSVQVIELEIDESDNNKHEKGNNSNMSSSSESSSEEEEVLEEKEKVVQINGKEELAPITTKDLTSITEEPNDSSNISSSSSSPETPSSAQSPRPRMRLRKDSKFNERRKSMTNKLKRAFSSASSSSSKRNSIIST